MKGAMNQPVSIKDGANQSSFKDSWKKLIQYCKPYLTPIIIALILGILGSFLQVIGPNLLKDITNAIQQGVPTESEGHLIVGSIDMTVIGKIAGFLIVIYLASAVLNFLQGYIMATITQKNSQRLRTDISHKINKLPLKYFDRVSQGDVLSRVTNDVDTIGQTLNQSLGTLVSTITLLVGSIAMMFYNSWILALVAIGSSLIGVVLMRVIMKNSQKYFIQQQQGLGDVNGHIEEIFAGHNVVKVYNGSKDAIETFEKYNTNLYNSGWRSQFLSGLMMPLMNFVGNLGYVAVCVVGAALVIQGTISIGVIVAFIVFVRMFTQPLSQMAQAAQNMQRTAAASDRVFEFLSEEELSDESGKTKTLGQVKGAVDFENVEFGYEPNRMIIHDFSASVKPGEKVAIVGPTGAGKTTMVNLLMRFYEINKGRIAIDQTSIGDVKRQDVHNQFCMVLQDTWLFEGTIKENIVYSKQNVTDEEVERACRAVGLHHFIETMPQGYDTVLNDKTSISQGQKQLVTIARAFIQNAPMLILDEATSSVDTRTEAIIQDAMDKLMEGRTSFVIAHRLSTIKNADTILVMKDGDIIESGNHEELLAKNGFYAELYNSQFEVA